MVAAQLQVLANLPNDFEIGARHKKDPPDRDALGA